jgi:hypothetical protein
MTVIENGTLNSNQGISFGFGTLWSLCLGCGDSAEGALNVFPSGVLIDLYVIASFILLVCIRSFVQYLRTILVYVEKHSADVEAKRF